MTSASRSQILWPRPSLAGCIFCAIERDTRQTELDQSERFNFFPASPFCCITGIVHGELHQITNTNQMERPWTGQRVHDLSFSGAQLGPLVSWSPGEIYVITIGFYPDAFSRLAGLDLSSFTGRMVPAKDVITQDILGPCQAFFNCLEYTPSAQAFTRLQDDIDPLWSAARPDGATATRWLSDWTKSLVAKAALSGSGKSARQISRRIKSWSGANQRELASLGQTERLYATMHSALQSGDLDWAAIATASGFSDQAHMIRRLRKHTGFTPEQLRKMAQKEEALWGYRLLGEYFSRPRG
ncbi:MAG: helix-turn-helix domain-containing protein [Filomicrobium sp.]